MANQYNITDIFKYEDKTRHYCMSEGCVDLSTRELIELAGNEKHLDINYVKYLIFKYLHTIEDYCIQKAKKKGYQLSNIKDNHGIKRDLIKNNTYYEEWIEFYEDEAFRDYPDVFEVIDQALIDNNWNFLYYLYYKEESEFSNLLTDKEYEDKQKNRKFFIIQ